MNNAFLQPKISVCLITYNHEAFIPKAIESILEQKGNFKYEIVIGVDLSTDKTLEICFQYQKKHPEIIQVLDTKKRLGLMKNYSRTLQACTGEFIAFCSGDDYWIDPEKLQKQLTFLEENTTYGLVYSNYKVLLSSRNLLTDNAHNSNSMPQGNCKDQFINGSGGVMTITSLIRREALNTDYFTFIDDKYFLAEDFTLFMWVAFDYLIGYIKDETCVYRVHEKSFTNAQDKIESWNFMRSHVYMRKKFLLEKKYLPDNHIDLEVKVARETLTFCAKKRLYPQHGIANYRIIKKYP